MLINSSVVSFFTQIIMKKVFLISALVFVGLLMAPLSVQAETCVTQYGGAVVCGAATPVFHAPVKTGLADINFTLVGTFLLGTSAVLYIKSKRTVAH